jgi:hypothetical protein
LGARTRAKYDALKAQLDDFEALQRALHERIKSKEDRAADLMRRYDYCARPGGDSTEAERLERELTSARADLDKLERERGRRNAARANTEQVCSRLDNFILSFYSGAADIEPPQWPTSVPGPNDDESITDALLRIRHEIGIAQGEARRVQVAPLPASEVRAAIEAEVDRMASSGVPHVSVAAGKVEIIWPDQQRHAVPGSALSAPSGSASQLDCWRDPDGMKKRLTAGITGLRGAIPAADRPRLIREAEARILALEIAEERLVMAALDQGLEVHRRIGANPWVILNADAAHAEAAE